MSGVGRRLAAALLVAALAVAGGCRWSPGGEPAETPALRRAEPAPPALEAAAPTLRATAGTESLSFESPFVAVANLVLPGVVNIESERRFNHATDPSLRSPQRELFRELFPDVDPEFRAPSEGSGFVIDPEGIIVTNNHVVDGSDRVSVTFADGETRPAEIVGVDPSTDIAVLRVGAPRRLEALRLGDSDRIRVGDWAIAVGNPFGKLAGSVTVGVVSAKGRSDLDIEGGAPALQDFIQTDASINFGNSGGPLVNIHGEVIGMNTAINPTGQGIGFAIPVNLLRRTVDQLIAHGRVIRGYLGIFPQELTSDLAEGRGLRGVRGILVGQVLRDTPASRAGLQVGDVITRFDGTPVTSVSGFRILVAEVKIGRRVRLDVQRGGKSIVVDVIPVERPDAFAVEPESLEEAPDDDIGLGLEVAEITSDIRRDLGLGEADGGVLIDRVREGSPADRAGLEPGAVVLEIGDRAVRSVADFRGAIDAHRGTRRPIVFLVRSDDTTRFVAVRPE
jgi:Do/DeqQ family serine protease